MIPISDENPTLRTPVATYLLLAAIFAVWLLVQGGGASPVQLTLQGVGIELTLPGVLQLAGDVALFDEAEVHFPFEGMIEFEDVEEHAKLTLDARGMRGDYLKSLAEFQDFYRRECAKANIDYVPMDTSVSFDKALLEYLLQRQKRF